MGEKNPADEIEDAGMRGGHRINKEEGRLLDQVWPRCLACEESLWLEPAPAVLNLFQLTQLNVPPP